MSPELNKQLVDKYPLIFKEEEGIEFGIECGDGWYKIIEILCREIQGHVNWAKCDQVTVDQVKEKFGGLRFYHSGGDQYIAGLISMAEAMAEITCEKCGNPGEIRDGSWIKTLCDVHHLERKYNQGR